MSADSATATAVPKPIRDMGAIDKVYILLLLLLVYISNYADRVLFGILMPMIKKEFSFSDFELGLLGGTAFAVFYAIMGIPIAIYADRGNRKAVIVVATTVWSIMTAACGRAFDFVSLFATRVGVGIGEAGSNPPSHSILSDLFPPKHRATALAIFSQGVSLGLVAGLYFGAQIAATYGWRAAFYALGLPGLLVALLVQMTMIEPRRGASEGVALTGAPPKFWQTVRFMAAQPALRNIVMGATLTTFVGYSGVLWWAEFLMRSHGLTLGDLSRFLSLVFGLGSGIGIFLGGIFSDYFGRRDVKLMPRVVAIALLFGLPFGAAVYLVPNSALVFAVIGIPAAAGGAYLGPTMAMVQSLVAVRMRTVASAIVLFIINFVGMGIGSLVIGAMSDALTPTFQQDALRYTLLIVMTFNLWAAFHYWRAGASMAEGLKRAQEASS